MDKLISSITNPLNLIFIVLMVGLFIWEIITKKDLKSIIVSIGVLGTFVGIFTGLLDFDTHNLKISIEHILEGLKTAFLTSIVGMGLSIILSIIEKNRNKYDDEDKEFQVLNEINEKLSNLSSLDKINNDKVIEELERLRLVNNDMKDDIKTIKNNDELNNKTIQELLSSGFTNLNHSLELAIEHLSKGATEEIINALKKVISEFNQELQTQFGENFVKLNESVINLLLWQENYKSHVENTEIALNTALTSIKNTESSLTTIENSQKNIKEIYKNLEDIIKTSKLEIDELNRHLETYKDLSNKSKEYLDNLGKVNDGFNELINTIENNSNTQQTAIKQLTESTSETIKTYIQTNQDENQKSIDKVTELYENLSHDIANNTNKQQESIKGFIENSIKEYLDNLGKVNDEFNELTKTIEDSSKIQQSTIKEFIENSTLELLDSFEQPKEELKLIIEHFKQIEQQIPKALGESLESLNSGLASLTKKFQADYEEILNKYKKNIRK
jgi:DNA repair exonuclease SbcCD ATPase subunit